MNLPLIVDATISGGRVVLSTAMQACHYICQSFHIAPAAKLSQTQDILTPSEMQELSAHLTL